MKKVILINLFMFVFIVGLFMLVFMKDDINSEEAARLTDISASDIDHISIQHRERLIELELRGEHWYFTEPIAIEANDFRVNSLLKLLGTLSHSRYRAEEVPLQSFGLVDAQTVVTFNNTEIAFGITNSVNGYRYILVDGIMHMIDDLYYPLLSSQLGTLVSLNMLERGAVITKLELPDQTLSRDENGLWQSSNGELSADAIVETVSNWQSMQAFGVHDYLERESLGEICITLEGQDATMQFIVVDTDPWLIIARPGFGLEYHFNVEAYDALLSPGTVPVPSSDDTTTVPADEFMNAINR